MIPFLYRACSDRDREGKRGGKRKREREKRNENRDEKVNESDIESDCAKTAFSKLTLFHLLFSHTHSSP